MKCGLILVKLINTTKPVMREKTENALKESLTMVRVKQKSGADNMVLRGRREKSTCFLVSKTIDQR